MNYKEQKIFGFKLFNAIKHFKFDMIISELTDLRFAKRNGDLYIYFSYHNSDFRMSRLYEKLPNSITHNSQLAGILWDNIERVKLEKGYSYGWSGGIEWNSCYSNYEYENKLEEDKTE